jgi:Domain of unknown function (4846)
MIALTLIPLFGRALRITRAAAVTIPLGLALQWGIAANAAAEPRYTWKEQSGTSQDTLERRIAPPAGFVRTPQESGSWGEWLRGLPMKPAGAPVLTYTGAPKWRQDVHVAVVDIDVGKRDLQQCADAVMRLRAEWLFGAGRKKDIAFNYTDGKRRAFSRRSSKSYRSFRKYMTLVFAYAGTYSLERELKPVSVENISVGDVFIKGGFPGHAVLVADIVENPETRERRFLLLQSYMPAQEIHVLKNPANADGNPWYATGFGQELNTPEWVFARSALRRWP